MLRTRNLSILAVLALCFGLTGDGLAAWNCSHILQSRYHWFDDLMDSTTTSLSVINTEVLLIVIGLMIIATITQSLL